MLQQTIAVPSAHQLPTVINQKSRVYLAHPVNVTTQGTTQGTTNGPVSGPIHAVPNGAHIEVKTGASLPWLGERGDGRAEGMKGWRWSVLS